MKGFNVLTTEDASLQWFSKIGFDIVSLSNILLDLPLQARAIKAKINKQNYIKLENFCTVKEAINKMKRQPTEWEKILANDMFDKGLIFKIYK